MARKRSKSEEIVAKLRQVDVLTSQGQNIAAALRSNGSAGHAGVRANVKLTFQLDHSVGPIRLPIPLFDLRRTIEQSKSDQHTELEAILMTAAPEERFTRLRGKVAIAPVHAVRRALENPFVANSNLCLISSNRCMETFVASCCRSALMLQMRHGGGRCRG
jgi:hypothetical protein